MNKIINSAIAQHARKQSIDSDPLQNSRVGFSANISQMEAEPIYN